MARKRRRNKGKNINGILLLDKPKGLSSNQALQQVKRLYQAAKAGHTGSLDPLATGMLPICFGEATKVCAYLLDSNKRYRAHARLGQCTDTGDSEGAVIQERPVPTLSEAQVNQVLAQFLGDIEQVPPMYSALRQDGKRLYELAREGIEVERKPRQVTIHALSLEQLSSDQLILDVSCSKGTYIRTLVEDIGEQLGCGAHVSDLRRLTVSPYQDAQAMVTMEQLIELADKDDEAGLLDQLLPIESALTQWPDVYLSADSAYYLGQGQAVLVPKVPSTGMVRLFESDNRFLGLGEVQDDGKVAPKRLFFVD